MDGLVGKLILLVCFTNGISPKVIISKECVSEEDSTSSRVHKALDTGNWPAIAPFELYVHRRTLRSSNELKVKDDVQGTLQHDAYVGFNKLQSCLFEAVLWFKEYDLKMTRSVDNHVRYLDNNVTSQATSDWIVKLVNGHAEEALESDKDYTGDKVIKFFQSRDRSFEKLFVLRLEGPVKHSWVIHQLPMSQGYRIYQSVKDTFSLNAWLTKDAGEMEFLWQTGDIRYWEENRKKVDVYLQHLGSSLDDLDNLQPIFGFMKPYFLFVKTLEKDQIFWNLKKSWNKYGQGKVLNKFEFFQEYLLVLGNLTKHIKPLVDDSKIWTSSLDNQWIELFGAANPDLCPGLPFETMTQSLDNKPFKMSIQEYTLTPEIQRQMKFNAELMSENLNIQPPACFDEVSSNLYQSSAGVRFPNIFLTLLVSLKVLILL